MTDIYDLISCSNCGSVFDKSYCKKEKDKFKNTICKCLHCKDEIIIEEYKYY